MTLSPRLPPAASTKSTLVTNSPSASTPACVRIGHVQLRDLLVCPAERGVLWYIADKRIVEQDLLAKRPERQHTLAALVFTPVTISALRLHSSPSSRRRRRKELILLAAGGQDAELFLALYQYTPRQSSRGKSFGLGRELFDGADTDDDDEEVGDVEGTIISERTTMIWQHMSSLVGSINNNVMLYMPPLAPTAEEAAHELEATMSPSIAMLESENAMRPRLVVSNNDCTVKFFDVSLARGGMHSEGAPGSPVRQTQTLDSRYWRRDFGRSREGEGWGDRAGQRIVRYERVGCLRLDVPVNHTSISPDGSTVLACGDASTIFLYRILPKTDGNMLVFEPLASYAIPVPPSPPRPPPRPLMRPIRASRSRDGEEGNYIDAPPSGYLPYAFVGGGWVVAGSHSYYAGLAGADSPPACFATAWSADGMRFAAAGQEGAVRVWDVRSQNPLQGAQFETVPDMRDGNEETIGVVGMWYDHPGAAPPWGIRALKFARNASGREVLVFTEHVSRVHVVDADTFSVHDVVRVPHVRLSARSPSSSDTHRATQPSSPSYHDPYRLSTLPPADSTDIVFGSAVPHRRRAAHPSLVPMRADAIMPPTRVLERAEPSTRMLETDGAPFVRSPEALDNDITVLNRAARPDYREQHHSLRRANTVDENSLEPESSSSMFIRRMTRQYQRFLDDVTPSPLANPSPAQEEDMRSRARIALRLLREAEETSRDSEPTEASVLSASGHEDFQRESEQERSIGYVDRGGDNVDTSTSNLSSRSILHSLMMRSSHMSSNTAAGASRPPLPVSARGSVRNNRASASSRVPPPTAENSTRETGSHSSSEVGGSSLFVPRGRRTQARPSSRADVVMDEDEPGAEGEVHSIFFNPPSPPPPVSAGVLSQSSFASSVSPIEGDQNWTGSSLPGLLSASESETGESGGGDDDDDGDELWTGTSSESNGSRGSRNSSSIWMPSSPGRIAFAASFAATPDPSVPSPEPRIGIGLSGSRSQVSQPQALNPPTATSPTTRMSTTSTSETLPSCQSLIDRIEPLDIAGVCFDPTGAYMYVATTDGLTEWPIKGANSQRWWSSSGYI